MMLTPRMLKLVMPALALLLTLLGGALAGYQAGKRSSAVQVAQLESALAEKDASLRNAASALGAAGRALRAQQAEHQRMKRREAELAAREVAAQRAADQAARSLSAEQRRFERRLQNAQRREACALLTQTDVRQVCGNLY